jgi:hypothetical protein
VDGDGNNRTGERPDGVQSVTVSCDPLTMKLHLEIDTPNIELALVLLERAHRELEARFRFNRARELASEAIQAQSIADLVSRHPGGQLVQG